MSNNLPTSPSCGCVESTSTSASQTATSRPRSDARPTLTRTNTRSLSDWCGGCKTAYQMQDINREREKDQERRMREERERAEEAAWSGSGEEYYGV